jgi:hypothetical protein
VRAAAAAATACAAAALAGPAAAAAPAAHGPAAAAAVSPAPATPPLALARPLAPLPALTQGRLAPIETLPAPPLAPLPALARREERARRLAWRAAFGSAVAYARTRLGRVSVALVDDQGVLHAYGPSQLYRSASLVKAMMLVALLRRVGERPLPRAYRRLLTPMITRSDNSAATRVVRIVGLRGLAQVARAAGMHHFASAPRWGDTQIAVGDQARFFDRIDALVPARHRAYARALLGGVVASQRWGVAEVAPIGASVLFKGGWRPVANGWIVHQAALVGAGSQRVSLAVLTDGNRSEGYGHETIRGVARRALAAVAAP